MPENESFTPARSCDGCTLCCRVLEATSLNKPMGVLCTHCIPGTGCGIHATRGEECRAYVCGWLIDGSLGPEWHPETAHLVMTFDMGGHRLNVHADPLKTWASNALPRGGQVIAYLEHETFVILPNRHVALGLMGPRDQLYIERLPEGGWNARKVSNEEADAIRRAGLA
jgi:hypothetical protein